MAAQGEPAAQLGCTRRLGSYLGPTWHTVCHPWAQQALSTQPHRCKRPVPLAQPWMAKQYHESDDAKGTPINGNSTSIGHVQMVMQRPTMFMRVFTL
mmetsp:Transcript_50653/g.90517  ORF Transcript_50653/g.90517 Transcript_50653/m.90517 type:complete len:97 (+) Transcript_50653:420-710(+)